MPKAEKKPATIKTVDRKSKKTLAIKPLIKVSEPLPAAKHTKCGILVALLQRSQGATITDLAEATGWQRHSVHGTISGVLKKRMGYQIAQVREERGLVYRIAA